MSFASFSEVIFHIQAYLHATTRNSYFQTFDCLNVHFWRKNSFLGIVDKHAPLRSKRVRALKSPWVTPYLKQGMHERDIAKLKATRSNDPVDLLNYKQIRNSVNNAIRQAKKSYYTKALHDNEGNSRMTSRVVDDLTSRKSNGPSVKEIKQNGVSICNPQELATAFNNHFATVGPKLANEIPLNNNGRTHLHYMSNPSPDSANFEFMPTNRSKVLSLLSKLIKSKAIGLDKISAKLLRICADLIADSLCLIFNSITTGIFPEEWKCSKVVPVFKQGDRTDLDNYRPISIIPVVAKVFERIIYDQLYAFLMDNNILSSYQSGFRSLHSTVTSLLEATDDWAYNIDQGNVNAVVFLDLKKAFDTVDHSILISKLAVYGIGGASIEWLKSYLSERNQKFFPNGSLSNNCVLSCGIPQGTILGPLLFSYTSMTYRIVSRTHSLECMPMTPT